MTIKLTVYVSYSSSQLGRSTPYYIVETGLITSNKIQAAALSHASAIAS